MVTTRGGGGGLWSMSLNLEKGGCELLYKEIGKIPYTRKGENHVHCDCICV